jgi:hypothetical protein
MTTTKVAGEAAVAGQGWWERRQEEFTTADHLLQAGAAVVLRMLQAVLQQCSFSVLVGLFSMSVGLFSMLVGLSVG